MELRKPEAFREDRIDRLFRAAGEATEEAILNSMVCASAVRAPDGHTVRSLAEFPDLLTET